MSIKQLVSFSVLIMGSFFGSIVNAGEVRIVTAEEPPTNYTYEGKFTGITTDIVEEIIKYLKTDVEIEVLPWARAYGYAKTLPDVVIFTAAKTQDRIDHGFHFIGPAITRKYVLFKKKGTLYRLNSLEDIVKQKLVVGAMLGDWRSKFFKDQGITVDEAASHKLNVRKLIKGRFHLWALSDVEAPSVLNKAGFEMDEIEIAYVFKEGASYIMLSKDTSGEIVERWRKAFAEIQKTDFFKKATKKWSDILEINIGYKTDKGFFIVE